MGHEDTVAHRRLAVSGKAWEARSPRAAEERAAGGERGTRVSGARCGADPIGGRLGDNKGAHPTQRCWGRRREMAAGAGGDEATGGGGVTWR